MAEEQALTVRNTASAVEAVIAKGDLAKLTPEERVSYYRAVCQSMGLNELTQPFQYITLNGKLTLYPGRGTTDQLRKIHKVSVAITARERMDDLYVVTARGSTPDSRTDESIGAVSIKGLMGDALANAIMKGETKAKRRVTLSIIGLGWLDESEVSSIPNARPVTVTDDGEIVDAEPVTDAPSHPPTPPQPEQSPNAAPASGEARRQWAPADQNRWKAELRQRSVSAQEAARLCCLKAGEGWSSLGSIDEVLAGLDAAIEREAEAEDERQMEQGFLTPQQQSGK